MTYGFYNKNGQEMTEEDWETLIEGEPLSDAEKARRIKAAIRQKELRSSNPFYANFTNADWLAFQRSQVNLN